MSELTDDSQPTTVEETYPPVPAAVADSRFLFVDVAAQRAKQLRRGALSRLQPPDPNQPFDQAALHHEPAHKLERVAMEEVRRGLIPAIVPRLPEGPAAGGA